MARWVTTLIFLISLFFMLKLPVLAADESSPNNKFGIHLALPSEEDLEDAASLVNSSGGDWGYVTLVIGENDRQGEKWQRVFDQMRKLHLIPIVRLATSLENKSWRRPKTEEAKGWADFLNSLNWVVKNRYVVLFNEVNRGDEWGGQVDAQDYGRLAFEFAKTLKEKNPDFFVMLSGFDAASPQKLPDYENEESYLRKIFTENKEITNYLDGWASHSYPNHGFVGSPWDSGRNSIKTYLWELDLLKRLGIEKNLPVFVTETGWPHAEGKTYQRGFYSQEQVSSNFRSYFPQILDDPKVWAVSPFILNYQDEPFDHFSWRKMGNSRDFYPQYESVKSLAKVKGDPSQEQKMTVLTTLPKILITGSMYQFPISIRNDGQAIWSQEDNYKLQIEDKNGQTFEYFFSDFWQLKPLEEQTIWLYFKTGDNLGDFDLSLVVAKNEKPLSNKFNWHLEVIPAPDVTFKVSTLPKIETWGDDFKIVIYNEKEEPVFGKSQVIVEDGFGEIKGVKNLAIGQKYRLVILKPHYLPRQEFLTVKEDKNEITFERMLPLDFNLDGKLSFGDLSAFLSDSHNFSLFWPAN